MSGGPGLEIRVAEPGDSGALVRLISGFRDHLEEETPSDESIEEGLPRAMTDASTEFAVAWLSGEPVGYTQTRTFFSVWDAGPEVFLEDLFVAPGSRRASVGRQLLRYVVARAEAAGAKRLSLTTHSGNEAAQSLYRSEGLEPDRHSLYPEGSEIVWSRKL